MPIHRKRRSVEKLNGVSSVSHFTHVDRKHLSIINYETLTNSSGVVIFVILAMCTDTRTGDAIWREPHVRAHRAMRLRVPVCMAVSVAIFSFVLRNQLGINVPIFLIARNCIMCAPM